MRDEQLYLADLVAAADAIGRFVTGMAEDEWIEDEVKQSAVMQTSEATASSSHSCTG